MLKITACYVLLFSTLFVVMPCCAQQLQFIENKGQWEQQVHFKSNVSSGAFFLEKKGYTVVLHDPTDMIGYEESVHGGNASLISNKDSVAVKSAPTLATTKSNPSKIIHSHAYKVSFVSASDDVQIVPDKPLSTYNNYFIGNDKSKWQGHCKIYQSVTYKNVYPNIDVHYYINAGALKYDIIVRPGGNVDDIQMQYDGVDKMEIKNKELLVNTSVGQTKQLDPQSYQLQSDERQTIDCRYVLKGNIVKFKVEEHDPSSTIIIDPTLVFSTFTGSTADNWGYTATYGPDGSFYAGGTVFNTGYPVTTGAYQTKYDNGIPVGEDPGYDMGIMKFSPDGSQRIYATYLGGKGNEQPHSMICDAQGNLIVAGRTNSDTSSFPTTIPQKGPGGGYDIFVVKFNATGTALIGSVKMGGSGNDGVNIADKETLSGASEINRNYGDDARSEVILDANNNIYLASSTQSKDFPVSNSNIQPTFGGGKQDGTIIEFAPDLSSVIFSTFFGGTGDDACFVLSLSPTTNNLYVAGGTTSKTLPGDTTNVISGSFNGGNADGFVTEVKANGSAIIKTTYEGTPGDDLVYGLKFDKYGFPYIMGATTGNWPIQNATFSSTGGKQFIAKLQPDLSTYVYSTVFGTNSAVPNISPVAFLVDRCQNVYVSGWGGEFDYGSGYPNAGTNGLPVTPDAIKPTTDGNDFYFFVLEKNAASQLYGSFFGENGGFNDHVDGGTSRFDPNGVIYEAICANCYANSNGFKGSFPTTPGAWSTTNPAGGFGCNEAAIKIAFNLSGIAASIKASINGIPDTIGCVPLTIAFADTIAKAKQYVWDFGDGTPAVQTTTPTNSHLYTTTGTFKVMLLAIDSSTCNTVDTAYTTVRIGSNIVTPGFFPTKIGGCKSDTFQFTNTTTAVKPIYTDSSFLWDFGDGSAQQKAGYAPILHNFPSAGTYIVSMMVIDTIFCNIPDTARDTIDIAANVKSGIGTAAMGCAPYNAVFNNTSSGGDSFQWDFGDGGSSTAFSPTHLYTDTGTYKVRLIANDSFSCNKADTVYDTVTVVAKPMASFAYSPAPSRINTPTQFENRSISAINYVWDFGDGSASIQTNPSHQFNATDTFHVCLVALNANGCADTVCQDISAIVNPLVDVPNAFTPGENGIDGVIKVQGFGISKMQWNIYNRWGQLVFTSSAPDYGWDGTYKGTAQPVDVYTYTLSVGFTDGKEAKKTGSITLIR